MTALVPELANMASDPSVSTGDLLRRALVAARRLAVPDLVAWINHELNGYGDAEVPDYRRVRGHLCAEHPYGGEVSIIMPPEISDIFTEVWLRQSVPELTKLAQTESMLMRYFPPDGEKQLMGVMERGAGYSSRPYVKFSSMQVQGAVERVRSRILDWALDLEDRGIIGNGMTFTQQEKQAVSEQHFHFGNIQGTQVQIGTHASTQTNTTTTTGVDLEALRGLIDALTDAIDRQQVSSAATDELRAELATLQAQAASPKPKWEVIKATARSIKTVAEGAAGGILAELAKPHMATLLALAAGAAGS